MENKSEFVSFTADRVFADKNSKEKTRHIIGIFVGIFMFALAFIFFASSDGNRSMKETFEILKYLCISIGLLEVILSPIALVFVSKTEEKLAHTFITLYEDRVDGIQFGSSSDTIGQKYSVSYADIIEASVLSEQNYGNGNNICIKTKSGSYYGYQISQKATVVRMINERIAAYEARLNNAEKHEKLENVESIAATAGDANDSEKCYCLYCGASIPKDSRFCYRCGREQKHIM